MEVKNESMKFEGNFADFHYQYIFCVQLTD